MGQPPSLSSAQGPAGSSTSLDPRSGQQGCSPATPHQPWCTPEGQQSRKINSGPGKKRRFFPFAGTSINHVEREKGPVVQGQPAFLPCAFPRGLGAAAYASHRTDK